MPNGRVLRHFDRYYYTRVPGGRRKRMARNANLVWQMLTRRQPRWVAHVQGLDAA
jgi:hypothetical protein